ncbi:MAG: hypothetical protein SF162_20565 [bacterium]|nr:hypothetical protein [bacterium]
MTHFRFILLLVIFLVTAVPYIFAQEADSTPPVEPPTQTATELPTETAAPLPTETATALPTETPTATPTLILESSPSPHPENTDVPVAGITETAAPVPTEETVEVPPPTPLIPTPTPDFGIAAFAFSAVAIQDPNTYIDSTFAVIAPADVALLYTLAVTASPCTTLTPYEIYLLPGTYILSRTLTIWCNTVIYGQGAGVTIVEQIDPLSGSMNTMITVNGTAALEVRNLTLNRGFSNTNGGAVFVWDRTALRIYDSILSNHSAEEGGGAIYAQLSTVHAERSIFSGNNAANSGGAILMLGSGTVPAILTGNCLTFSGNSAEAFRGSFNGGGAIFASLADVSITSSSFQDSFSPATGIGRHIFRFPFGSRIVNVPGNYWNNPAATQVPNFFIISNLLAAPPFCPMLPPVPVRQPPTPTPTVTPTATPSPTATATTAIPVSLINKDLPLPIIPPEWQTAYQEAQTQFSNGTPNVITFSPGQPPCETVFEVDSIQVAQSKRAACSHYAYITLYALYQVYTDRSPNVRDLMALNYYGEFNTFRNVRNTESAQSDSLEALFRSFFDAQSGGCRYQAISQLYSCSYDNLIAWLALVPSTYIHVCTVGLNCGATYNNYMNGVIVVDSSRVLGIPTRVFIDSVRNGQSTSGIFAYDLQIETRLTPFYLSLENSGLGWGTGQSGDRPSIWGNGTVAPGTIALPSNSEWFHVLITHTYSGTSQVSFDSVISLNGAAPTCSFSFIIATSDGRVNVTDPNATC